MCCKVLHIEDPALTKAGGVWCPQVVAGSGCGIYETRPATCRRYQCAWTISPHMGEDWRPDRAGFLAHRSDDGTLHVIVDEDRPDDWKREPYYSTIRGWSLRRGEGNDTMIVVHARGHQLVVFPEAEIDVGPVSNDPIYSGYELNDGKRVPYARYNIPHPNDVPPRRR